MPKKKPDATDTTELLFPVCGDPFCFECQRRTRALIRARRKPRLHLRQRPLDAKES